MIISAFLIRLHLSESHSRKDKRRRLKSLLIRLQREFNIAVAESGSNDMWQSAEVALVTVSNAKSPAESRLRRAVQWIENNYPDLEVVDVEWL